MVDAAMPGYALTAQMLGRPIRISPVHPANTRAPSRDGSISSSRPKEVLFEDYLRVFEPYGMRPARIIFRDVEHYPGVHVRDQPYWAVDFPGCVPGNCEATAANVVFQRSSMAEYDRYGARGGSLESFNLLRADVQGVRYSASVNVVSDAAGRVQNYRVGSYREPLSGFEELEANQYGGWLQFWGYANNLTLGVAVELSGPDRISSYL